jgi:catechol 2,3-dioxygenase-like lactoylglutathione lyase family enzyme
MSPLPGPAPTGAAGPALAPGDRIDHVAYAVRDIDAALPWWTDVLGLPLVHDETAHEPGSRLAYLDAGAGVFVQLVQPVRHNAVQDFLDTHEEGLHHVAFTVSSLTDVAAQLGDTAPVHRAVRSPYRTGAAACALTGYAPVTGNVL